MSRNKRSFILLSIIGLLCAVYLSISMSAHLVAETSAAGDNGDFAHIIGSQSPRLQTISSGDDAQFTVTISNTGTIPFENVTVTNAVSPNCNRNALGPLAPGDEPISYTCERLNVTQSYLNVIRVNGIIDGEVVATHQTDAYVSVRADEISVTKNPESQLVVAGDDAHFNVRIVNLYPVILRIIGIDDNLVDDCDINPAGDIFLLPSQIQTYSCSLSNVQEPMTTIITFTAEDMLLGSTFVATDAAWIEVLKLDASLTPSTTSIPEPGDVVTYTVDLVNSGSVPMTLTSLGTDKFGDLLDPSNPLVQTETNSCLALTPSLAPYGGAASCTFIAEVNSQPPAFTVALTAMGQEAGGLEVTATAESTIIIEDVPASISLSLGAEPPFISPPGELVTFNIHVENTSPADAITITQLEDEFLGDLHGKGTCALPVEDLHPGDTYSCQYADQVSGQDGDQHVREITAQAVSDDPSPENLSVSEIVTVGINAQMGGKLYFPVAVDDTVEPNNHCLLAYPLIPGRQYYFFPPQKYDDNLPLDQRDQDYFTFSLDEDARVEITLSNFLPQFVPTPPQTNKGQLIVRSHTVSETPPCVPVLSQHIITQTNHQFQASDNDVLDAGRYYIQLINDGPSNVKSLYGIRIRVEIP